MIQAGFTGRKWGIVVMCGLCSGVCAKRQEKVSAMGHIHNVRTQTFVPEFVRTRMY